MTVLTTRRTCSSWNIVASAPFRLIGQTFKTATLKSRTNPTDLGRREMQPCGDLGSPNAFGRHECCLSSAPRENSSLLQVDNDRCHPVPSRSDCAATS